MAYRFALVDKLLADDPALSRVRMGARVTLTVLLSIAVLMAYHLTVTPLPPITYGLAIILSIEGGVAVRDRSPRDQLVTRLMGCAVSLASISLATLLDPYRLLSDIVFLLVILAATMARVYGPRGFAIGMFAFTSYFIGAYLKPSLGQLHLAALGPLTAVIIGHVARTWIIRDDPQLDLRRSLGAVRRRTTDVLEGLLDAARDGTVTEQTRARLRKREERLKDVVLMAESFLPIEAGEENARGMGNEVAARIAMKIFDLHLAAESTIVLAIESPPQASLVRAVLDGNSDAVDRLHEQLEQDGDQATIEMARALRWLHQARQSLAKEGSLEVAAALKSPARSASEPPAPVDWSFANPLIRLALQITLASAIAMTFGLMLSRDRWFWAVLTAFLIFTNTKSRGDTAMRAIQRSVGTALGIAIGLGVATLLADHTVPAVILGSLCVFLAFYFLQVSYAVMSFFVSIVLCLVYGLIGQLTFDLLVLRVEETLIGAVAGTAVAFLVFPASTRSNVETALARWCETMRQLLEAARDGGGRIKLVDLSRRLDASYRDLTIAAKPLGASWSIVTRPGRIRRTLAIFLAATYWARILANGMDVKDRSGIAALAPAIHDTLAVLDRAAARGADCFTVQSAPRQPSRRHLPIFRQGSRLGMEMIGSLLERLYPKP
jgi:uncharacterized membrane protein YccC